MTSEALWRAVVPVRGFAAAKQRLRGEWPDPVVDELARRLATRTLAVLGALPEIGAIVVVTDEDEVSFSRGPRLRVLREGRPAGLNAAVRRGVRAASEMSSAGTSAGTLVLHADLPLLAPSELSEALARASATGRSVFVADAEGTGTTALAYRDGDARPPAFGEGSAARHLRAGFVPLALPNGHGLRADLDTREQLLDYLGGPRGACIEELLTGLGGACSGAHVPRVEAA